jgi:DNA-binding MarR family transcriptional regulator
MMKSGERNMNPALLSELINEILVKSTILGSDKSFVDGLTPRQAHIVMEIGTGSFRNGDLAARLGVEPSTLTRLLDPLVKGGIVDRGLNPDNRREVMIRLSDAGLAVLQELNDKMLEVCTRILHNVPAERLEQVEQGIGTLLSAIRKSSFGH